MKYRIKMMSGDSIYITEDEYQKIVFANAKGLIFIERLKGSVNMSSIESILPEDLIIEDKKEGRLHDGTRVIKKFGEWKDANNPDVRLNSNYYPEIANDTVMSEEEYQNKKLLK